MERIAPVESLDPGVDRAVENVGVGRDVGLERADVLPVALTDRAVERLLVAKQRREDFAGEVDGHVGCDVVEDLGLEHEDARVDGVGEDLTPARLLEEALDGAVLSGDDDAELERVLDSDQTDGRHRLLLVVELDQLGQVEVGEHVAGDDQEPLGQLVHRVANRAGGAEWGVLGGVDHADPELGAVAEPVADVVRLEGDGDDDVVEAVLLQQVDDVFHHRPVRQRHHRLGDIRGEGAQAGPLAAGHDHGLHGGDPSAARRRLDPAPTPRSRGARTGRRDR